MPVVVYCTIHLKKLSHRTHVVCACDRTSWSKTERRLGWKTSQKMSTERRCPMSL